MKINALTDLDLTVETKDAISEEFQTHVSEAVELEKVTLKEEYEKKLDEETSKILTKANTYIEEFCTKYVKDNEVQLESNAKVQIATEALEAIMEVVGAYGIEMPEKIDLLQVTEDENAELTKKVDELVTEKAELSKKLVSSTFEKVLAMKSVGLTVIQTENFGKKIVDLKQDDLKTFTEEVNSILLKVTENVKPVVKPDTLIVEDITPTEKPVTENAKTSEAARRRDVLN